MDALRRMHAQQGFDYEFPNIDDPLFLSKIVLQDGAGEIAMAVLARLTCEIYLLMEPGKGTPWERFERLASLQKAGVSDLRARGLHDAHAWLPPPIGRRFGRRLESLGWTRDDRWTPYSIRFAK